MWVLEEFGEVRVSWIKVASNELIIKLFIKSPLTVVDLPLIIGHLGEPTKIAPWHWSKTCVPVGIGNIKLREEPIHGPYQDVKITHTKPIFFRVSLRTKKRWLPTSSIWYIIVTPHHSIERKKHIYPHTSIRRWYNRKPTYINHQKWWRAKKKLQYQDKKFEPKRYTLRWQPCLIISKAQRQWKSF